MEKIIVSARGFTNFSGSACYFNSMIQALLGSSIINKVILKNDIENDKMYNLYKTTVKACKDNLRSGKILNLQELMYSLGEHTKINTLLQQNDPTEFITLFIELLGDDIHKLCNHAFMNTIVCNSNDIKHTHIKRETNVLLSVALNDIKTLQDYLKCNKESISYICDPTTSSTPLPTTITSSSSNEEKKVMFRQLSMAPKVLIIMVKNYSYTCNVRQEPISYPLTLKFPSSNKKINDWEYKVVSVVEHLGDKNIENIIRTKGSSGHYICTSQRNDGIYKLNDSYTQKVLEFPMTPNVCMIIYEL